MKKTFILDENVIIAASKGSKYAFNLLELIVQNCHRIAFDADLLDKYWKSLKRKRDEQFEVIRIVGQLTHHTEKCCYVPKEDFGQNPIPIHHQKDVFLVRIAQKIQCPPIFIVLTDKQSLRDINNSTQLKALDIKEAISYAREANC